MARPIKNASRCIPNLDPAGTRWRLQVGFKHNENGSRVEAEFRWPNAPRDFASGFVIKYMSHSSAKRLWRLRGQGAIATAVGIGASLSQAVAGRIIHSFGYDTGFLFLAAVAGAGLALLWFAMPETKDAGETHADAPAGVVQVAA